MNKQVILDIASFSGDAHRLMTEFSIQANKEGWTDSEINGVLYEAMSGDDVHLLRTILNYSKIN